MPNRLARAALETLERRYLFSTITVQGFTSAAVQQAITQSTPGDTIYFPAGTYNLNAGITVPGHRTFEGQVDPSTGQSLSILTVPAAAEGAANWVFQLSVNDATNDTFDALEFEGAGIWLQHDGAVASNQTVEDCTFTGQTAPHMLFWVDITNSTINNNFFINDFGSECILGYDQSRITISNNYFDEVNEGVHMLCNDSNYNEGITVTNNDFHYVSRMAVEIQGTCGNGILISNNVIGDYDPTKIGPDTFGLSIVTYATGAVVTDNQIQGPAILPNGSAGCQIGIEMAGFGEVAEGNDICGFIVGIAIQNPSENTVVKNNTLSGQVFPIQINTVISGFIYGPNDFPITPDCSEASPIIEGPNPPGGGGPIVTPPQLNSLPPPVLSVTPVSIINGTGPNATGEAFLTWEELAPQSSMLGYDIQREIFGVNSDFVTIPPTNGGAYTIDFSKNGPAASYTDLGPDLHPQGLPLNSVVYYRMRNYDSTGEPGPWSNIVVVRTPTTDSTLAVVEPDVSDPTTNVLDTIASKYKGTFASTLLKA